MIAYPTIALMKVLYIIVFFVLIYLLIVCVSILHEIWKDKDTKISTKIFFSFVFVLQIFSGCLGLFVIICEIINIF